MRPEALALLAAACWAVSSLFSAGAAQRLGAFAFSRWRMLFASHALFSAVMAWFGAVLAVLGAALILR